MEQSPTSSRSLRARLGLHKPRAQITLAVLLIVALLGITGAIFAAGTSTITVAPNTPGNVPESVGSASFVVSLSDPIADGSVQITVATHDGTGANGALAGSDYTAVSQVITFTPSSQNPVTINVPISDDADDELNETFTIDLSGLVNTSSTTILLSSPITVVIQDNDSPNLDSLTGPAAPVSEGAGEATFTATISAASPQPVTLNWHIDTGASSATIPPATPADVTIASGSWVIPIGQTSQTFTIGLVDDAIPEGSETFRVVIDSVANIANSSPLPGPFDVTIADNDTMPTVTTNNGLTVNEGASGTIGQAELEATDPEQGAAQLTFTLGTVPANGTLFLSGNPLVASGTFTQDDINNNQLTYTHNDSETTSDSFTFTVSDGNTSTTTQTFNITVTPVNEAPVVNDQTFSVAENSPNATSVGTVVATDPDGPALTYSITGGNTGGTFAINPTTGEITVADNTLLNFETNPTFSLTVQVSDGTLNDTATITINLTNINEAPVVNDQTFSVAENSPNATSVGTVVATDPDGPALTYSITGGNTGGAFAINPTTGEITVASSSAVDFETNPTFSLTVQVSDGTLNDTATVTINVTNVNDPPVANNDSYSTNEDTTLNVAAPGVLANDTDPEGSALTAVLVSGPANGTLTLNADGSFSYTPNANFSGSDSFTYTASDGTSPSGAATVTLTVTPVNDAPVASDDSYSTDEDVALNIAAPGVLANDTDVDMNTLTAVLVSGPSNGTLTLNANGSFSYTPNASYSGPDSFTYRANDGTANSNTATVSLTVNIINDAPLIDTNGATAGIDSTASYNEGAPATAITTASLTVSDEEGNSITGATVTLAGATATETLAVTDSGGITSSYSSATGVLTLSGTASAAAYQTVLQTLTYVNSSQSPPATRTVSIAATDNGTPVATSSPAAMITINIALVDTPPTLSNNGLTVVEGGTGNITTAELSASDPDTPDGSLVFTVTALPASGQLLKNGTPLPANGTFTQADIVAGLISYTHNGSETASDSFTFTLKDATTTLPAATFSITITPVNNAPVITTTSGATAYSLGAPPVVIDSGATLTDSDSPDFDGGQLRISLSDGVAGDLLEVRTEGTGAGQISVNRSTVSYGGVAIGTISGGAYPADLVISFTGSGATPAAVEALLRNITFSRPAGAGGPASRAATFTVSDGDGQTSAPASKMIAINQPPLAVDDTARLSINSGAQTVNVLANDSDPDNDSLTITAVTQGANGTVAISAGGGAVTYTPAADYLGPDSFTYTISDGRGGSATASVQVSVGQAKVFIPFVLRPAEIDLQVSLKVTPTSPQAGTATSIEVTVTNAGDGPASNFWVDLYINPSRAPQVNEPWNELCELDPCFGLAWFYTGTLAPGQSVVLNSTPQGAGNPNGFQADASIWPGFFANGTSKLYVIVDSWNRDASGAIRDPNGAIVETNETNNRVEQDITVTPGILPPLIQLNSIQPLVRH